MDNNKPLAAQYRNFKFRNHQEAKVIWRLRFRTVHCVENQILYMIDH
jgi:hypothetical protein